MPHSLSMEELIAALPEKARKLKDEHNKYLSRLRNKNPKDLDKTFAKVHEEVFQEMDCLECGNCCRSLGPKFSRLDMEKAGKFLNVHYKTFKSQYLQEDEDGDLVFRKMPCPFLETDNSCFIYDARPRACKEYPHTDNKNMRGLLMIMRDNLAVCPAVFEILERIRKIYPL